MDQPDANPGDGLCVSTPAGFCTLRAAIMETNALPGADTINVPPGVYTLTNAGAGQAAGDLNITDSVSIVGAGSGSTTIQASAGINDRVFQIAPAGPAITVAISELTIRNGNTPCCDGGGLLNSSGSTLTLANVNVQNNSTTGGNGGGIYNAGQLTLNNVTVSGNTASLCGGGIFNQVGATLSLNNATLSSNTTNCQGGGLYNEGGATLANVTISGNTAPTNQGGGIWNSGTMSLTNVTIANNSAPASNGGGVYSAGSATLQNTIVANNTGGNCSSTGPPAIVSNRNNLSSDMTCAVHFNQSGDQNNTPALLGPLANNGGFTETHALLPGSPAIDGVTVNPCPPPATDQRGVTRPQGSRCDIGAYELAVTSSSTATATRTATPTFNLSVTPTPATTALATLTATPGGTPSPAATTAPSPTAARSPTPTATAGSFVEVFPGNPGNLAAPPFALLAPSDADGHGPETITIGRLLPGPYTYAVHNRSGETPLAASGARVDVLNASGLLASFTVPPGSGRWWTVFTLDGATGRISPRNTLGDTPPLPSAVGAFDGRPLRLAHRQERPILGAPPEGLELSGPAAAAAPTDDGTTAAVSAAASARGELGAALAQDLSEQATLETRRPEVQWSAAGATDWQGVPSRQAVRSGDRVRTGTGASARLVYFEGTATEIGPETGVLVQRLERSPGGNIVGTLFQSLGTTVSRVVQLVDPNASFEIETPAATAFVRGTTPRVEVARDGATVVYNVPDGTGGLVNVQGKDPAASIVVLRGGQETQVSPGLPPAQPAPAGTYSGALSVAQQQSVAAAQQQAERQQERERQQEQAQQQAAQAQAALVAAEAELARLAQQEAALHQQVAQLLAATPTPSGGNDRAAIARSITPSGSGPCATTVGQVCQVGGDLAGSSGTVTASMSWRIVVPAGRIPAGAIGTVFISTTAGVEFFDCPPAVAGAPTICTGTTVGNGLQGGTVRVYANNALVAQGTANGPGAVFPSATTTRSPTPGASGTPTGTPSPTATLTPTPTGTPIVLPGQLRIVLTWGASPRDLDAHVWVPQ